MSDTGGEKPASRSEGVPPDETPARTPVPEQPAEPVGPRKDKFAAIRVVVDEGTLDKLADMLGIGEHRAALKAGEIMIVQNVGGAT